MRRNVLKISIAIALLSVIAAFFALGGHHYLALDTIKGQQSALQAYYRANPGVALVLFGLLYVVVAALSLPGSAIMTLASGAVFGFWPALIMVSFASTIGATLAFLASRFVLHDWVQRKFGKKLSAINDGMEREGAFYLFAIRLTPLFPFWLVNLLMGLTSIKVPTYYIASQLGMFPGTIMFVWAGTQLGTLQSTRDIVSPSLLAAFVALGVFPIVAKKSIAWWRLRRA